MKKHSKFREVVAVEKKSNKGTYIAVFFAAIMVLSVLSVFFQNPTNNESNQQSYGKYSFSSISTTGQWSTKINGKDTAFYFLPGQIANLPFPKEAIQQIKNSQAVVIAFNPLLNESSKLQAIDVFRFEVANAFVDAFPEKQLGYAVTEPTPIYNFSTITCANASLYMPVIMLDYANETNITMDNSCIKISVLTEYDLLEVMDYLRYSIYGVFDEKTK